jgi:hypothetical protein
MPISATATQKSALRRGNNHPRTRSSSLSLKRATNRTPLHTQPKFPCVFWKYCFEKYTKHWRECNCSRLAVSNVSGKSSPPTCCEIADAPAQHREPARYGNQKGGMFTPQKRYVSPAKAVCLPRKSGMFTPHNFFKAIVAQHFSGTLFPNTIRTLSTNRCARPHFTGGRACYNILATTPLLTQTEGTPRHQARVRKKTQNAREC